MSGNLKDYKISAIENIKIYGRNAFNEDSIALFWTGSGFEANVRGSELWMDIETDYEIYEQWISIEINGELVSRQMLSKGRSLICIFRGMNNELIKNVRVYKDVQPMDTDDKCIFLIHELKLMEYLKKYQRKKLRLNL
ncbi:hypothetical protein [Clostridium butyricum]|uniref:hypothetical protein n=1 Tax=Clostridium butyricum TaxID=1492 RepID=UPI000AC7AB15